MTVTDRCLRERAEDQLRTSARQRAKVAGKRLFQTEAPPTGRLTRRDCQFAGDLIAFRRRAECYLSIADLERSQCTHHAPSACQGASTANVIEDAERTIRE